MDSWGWRRRRAVDFSATRVAISVQTLSIIVADLLRFVFIVFNFGGVDKVLVPLLKEGLCILRRPVSEEFK